MHGGCPLRVLLGLPLVLCVLLSPTIFAFRRPLLSARPAASAFGWSSSKQRAATTFSFGWKNKLSASSFTSSWPAAGGVGAGAVTAPPNQPPPTRAFAMAQLSKITGGATGAADTGSKQHFSLSTLWGVVGVVAVLSNAIRRLLPIALEPFSKAGTAGATAFTPLHWAQYVGFALVMAYAEGYKGFQLKFSPLVVKRAMTLGPNSPFHHKLFAAPYSMGLFHASKKRQIVSWTLALGIVGLVKLVKTLVFPYRAIVDAGVVVGLSWGTASIAGIYIQALRGQVPGIDPAMPEKKVQ
ncbi:Hypothetical protein NocV09_00901270 [Nannochloropsis oceanica]